MKRTIRVLVVDDHEVARQGLRRMLETERDVEVLGDCTSGEEALSQIEKLGPDVVLMNARMPGIGGIEATRRIRGAESGYAPDVVIISDSAAALPQAMEAGAAGFILKDINQTELVRAIREVYKSEHLPEPDGLSEETFELVIPPPAGAAQIMQFVNLLERTLQASVVRTVGSWDSGTTITISLKPTPVPDLVEKLRALAPVENAHVSLHQGDSLSALLKGIKFSHPRHSGGKKLTVSLMPYQASRGSTTAANTSQNPAGARARRIIERR